MGARVTAPTPLIAAMNMSFRQRPARTSGSTSAVTPRARAKAAWSRSARSLVPPASSPKPIHGSTPAWRMCPGASIQATMRQRPPSTRSGPRASASWVGASTPLRRGTTKVSGPRRGLIACAASATCQVFTPRRIASAGPRAAGSSEARAGWIVKSPAMLLTRRPCARMARRWSPRATKATLLPGLGEAAAEVGTDGAGAEDGDVHA